MAQTTDPGRGTNSLIGLVTGSKTNSQDVRCTTLRALRQTIRQTGYQFMDKSNSATEARFFNIGEATAFSEVGSDGSAEMAVLLTWIHSYLMASNADLGRTGAVCPFTKQAAKLDTVRVAVSLADASRGQDAFSLARRAFGELNDIPSRKGMEHFRTVIIGFPGFAGEAGVAALKRVQRAHRTYSLARGRMIGLMHASSEDEGLWNRDFRPLRSPIPILAVRQMVEQDAPFAALHPALMLAYLARFPFKGVRRLASHWRGS